MLQFAKVIMQVRHLLQRHPIPMTCHFDHSLVVTWAVPAQALQPLVPPGLELDTYDGHWGFVVIALVQTRNLRPAFLPACAGRLPDLREAPGPERPDPARAAHLALGHRQALDEGRREPAHPLPVPAGR